MVDNYTDDPKVILNAIETDANAFLPGSRNDDICNWFFAKLLVELEAGTDTTRNANWYIQQFNVLFGILTRTQKISLESWGDSRSLKLYRLYDLYSNSCEDEIRNVLWIDQGGYGL